MRFKVTGTFLSTHLCAENLASESKGDFATCAQVAFAACTILAGSAFTVHLARLALMLADHHYSSLPATGKWQDSAYSAYANTDPKTKDSNRSWMNILLAYLKVHSCWRQACPSLRQTLPSITRHNDFKRCSQNDRFRWQDKSYELACGFVTNHRIRFFRR